MKRLLAYLFIVLGLGLNANVSLALSGLSYAPVTAAEQGREQNPSLTGDPNRILVNY